jgi:NAD(P)-dependent dehydrogenase (short-subunit alcohol dehydrogenase family)
MCVARTAAELAAVAAEAPVETLVASVSTEEGCSAIIDETRARLGPIEVLVNNAGVGTVDEGPIWKQDVRRWHESLDTNLTGPFHLTRLSVPDMIKRRFGRIVMVSSTAGEVGAATMSAYCASKAGLLGLMRAVACDVGPFGITCNAVLPGWVRTEMAEQAASYEAEQTGLTVDEVWAQRAAAYPANRVLGPQEVADVICFLVGTESAGVSGAAITVALGGTW